MSEIKVGEYAGVTEYKVLSGTKGRPSIVVRYVEDGKVVEIKKRLWLLTPAGKAFAAAQDAAVVAAPAAV